MIKHWGACLCLLALLVLAGCAATSPSGADFQFNKPVLTVGVSAHYQPVIWKEHGEMTGLEIDFAKQLAKDLGVKLVIKEYTFDQLFNALEQKEVDILMSGISITDERSEKVLFTKPYLRVGQMAIIRLADAARLASGAEMMSGNYRIGYVKGTTGEDYVAEFINGPSAAFSTTDEGIEALKNASIDYFIHDAPTVWNLANQIGDGERLLGLYKPLTNEQLGWAVAADNNGLKNDADKILARWTQTGRLRAMINQWIPVTIYTD